MHGNQHMCTHTHSLMHKNKYHFSELLDFYFHGLSASDRYSIKQHLSTQQWEAVRSRAAQMEPDTLNSGSSGPITGCNFSAFISFPACFVFPQNNGASNGNGLQIMGGILTLRSVSWWFVVTREKTRAACGSLKARLESVNAVILHASTACAVIAL